jgi:hypothetical protein
VSKAAIGGPIYAAAPRYAGARKVLGNLSAPCSAPWVLLGFIAGSRFTRVGRGLVAGVGATPAAFLGFYVAEAAVLDLGDPSPSGSPSSPSR